MKNYVSFEAGSGWPTGEVAQAMNGSAGLWDAMLTHDTELLNFDESVSPADRGYTAAEAAARERFLQNWARVTGEMQR